MCVNRAFDFDTVLPKMCWLKHIYYSMGARKLGLTPEVPRYLVKSRPTFYRLTLKHREAHECVVSTVATDALVLKHQAISIHNVD